MSLAPSICQLFWRKIRWHQNYSRDWNSDGIVKVDGYSYSPIDSLYFITTGPLLHLPGVSCDNFSGENRNNDQFFLSHCHTGKFFFLTFPAFF